MKYEITPRTRSLLNDIGVLMRETQSWLELVSPEARAEWYRLHDSLPDADDLRRGYLALSERDVEDVRSKFKRFRQIVGAAHPELKPRDGFPEMGLMPPPDASAGWSPTTRPAHA